MMIICVTLTLVVVFLYFYTIKPLYYWKQRGVKQSNIKWLLGDTWQHTFRILPFAKISQNIYNKFPNLRYTGIYQFMLPTLVIRDPNLLKQITVKDFDHFMDHGLSFIKEDVDPLWSKNLFALTGQRWREMRSILSPSFTSSKMKTMFNLIANCSENFVDFFLEKNQDLVELEANDAFTRYTNDVIATTAFGIKVDSLRDQDNEFYLMGKQITNVTGFGRTVKFFLLAVLPKLAHYLGIGFFDKNCGKYFQNLIDETIKTREEQGIVRPDMIHLLMEVRKNIHRKEEFNVLDTGFAVVEEVQEEIKTGHKKLPREFSNVDIAAQAMIFFFAGFSTVSSLMNMMAYELCVNQDIQDRLREEVNDTANQCKGKLRYEALLKMKYMDMVVSETMRKWPIVIVGDRLCSKSYTLQPATPEEKPIFIEKGTPLWLPVYAIHRDSVHFSDPERFDPDRFNDDNKINIKPYTYFPFGLGPRACIGSRFALLEIKSVFFYILLNFILEPTPKTVIPLVLSKKEFVLTPDGGIFFGLRRIKK